MRIHATNCRRFQVFIGGGLHRSLDLVQRVLVASPRDIVNVFTCLFGVHFAVFYTVFKVCLWSLRSILSALPAVHWECISPRFRPCSKCACGPTGRCCRHFQLFIGGASHRSLGRVQSVVVVPPFESVDVFSCALGMHLTAL